LIKQEDVDNELHFIISGRVAIRVNHRDIAYRCTNTHVGEMALIDTGATRSASVIAVENTLTAKISEHEFTKIANKYPSIWRYLAIELGARLRQRNQFVRKPNSKPRMFFGSSKESIPLVKEIIHNLDTDKVEPIPWTKDIFWPSHSTLEDLERQLPTFDFAVFIFGPEDSIISRGKKKEGPRDNVVLEYGMFVGAIGRDRTYFIKPRNVEIKTPSDIFGLKPLVYEHNRSFTKIDVKPVAAVLMKCITRYSVR